MKSPYYVDYPRTVSHKQWSRYIGRKLTKNEKKMLDNVKYTVETNNKLNNLYTNCDKHGYYVPFLTKLNGDCIFESLSYLGYGNAEDIRKGIANIMYLYKDYKNFIEGSDDTLLNMFNIINVRNGNLYVQGETSGIIYKYNYDVMCVDLCCNSSWEYLPTELILMVISRIYKLNIKIIDDEEGNELVGNVNAFNNSNSNIELETIYLGHLIENHYLPLKKKENDMTYRKLKYKKTIDYFHKWGRKLADEKCAEIEKFYKI